VQDIANSLSEPLSLPGRTDFSLAGGTTGLAIFFAYLSQARSEKEAAARGFLEEAIAAASDGTTQASLYGGLAGVGWAAAHLQDRLADLDTEDITAKIDDALSVHLSPSRWTAEYDLINGLVGLGVYALERLPRPAAVAGLEQVIDHLAATAERRPEGITWWTNPDWLIPETRERHPRGYHDLGLAHGVPGVIALLGRACAAGVAEERARPLLDGAVRWLMAQRISEGPAAYISIGERDIAPAPARLAWCYGDLGIALSLLGSARCVGEADWEHAALVIARRAAGRPPEQSGVVDAGLCHGAAGVGHLFNRLFQATGEDDFAEASCFWLERTLALRQPGRGIAGYLSWSPDEAGALTWLVEPGLLTGAAGIALALLAATTSIEPDWDRLLLVWVAPRNGSLTIGRQS
jgi:lantibiotic modifying enzyme